MIIDGKGIAETILSDLKKDVAKLNAIGVFPKLAVIMIGSNPSSKVYLKNKRVACEKAKIESQEYLLPENTPQDEICKLIEKLNNDKSVSGILIQLPLPAHLNERVLLEKVSPLKDVDAFTNLNMGKLMCKNADLLPCTPNGILEIFKRQNITLQGKHCVVIGRSNIVGKPLAMLLIQNDATVTVCHSKTENLESICRIADIIICAVGKPRFLSRNMVKYGSVVIDVGINKDKNGVLCGDVDFENVAPICSYITPVPGGVGPLTVAMLVKNTIETAKIQKKSN